MTQIERERLDAMERELRETYTLLARLERTLYVAGRVAHRHEESDLLEAVNISRAEVAEKLKMEAA